MKKKKKIGKKKNKVKKVQQTQNTSHFLDSVKHYSTSRHVHFIIGLLLCFFTVYVGISLLSFFFAGADDQSIVNNLKASDLIMKKSGISNWGGVRGAYISDLIVNQWFGVSAFFLLFLLGSVAFKIMRLCKVHVFKRLILCLLLTIWSSVLLAFVSSGFKDSIFFHLGGLHGKDISEWLSGNIGNTGLILVLVVVFVLIAIMLNKNIIPIMQSTMSVGKHKKKVDKIPARKSDTSEEEENEQDDEDEDEDEGDDEDVEIEEEEDDEGDEDNNLITIKPNSDDDFSVEVPRGEEEGYDLSELGTYDPRLDLSGYRFPDINLLKKYENTDKQVDMDEQNENQKRIKKTLEDFGINIVSIKATVGPTITLYEVIPDKGVRIAKIRNLEDDIALSLAALGIRIIAPMPGKGTIGIEVPNKKPQIVS
ncbi:MAG: DNA translocase FtsK 4TM domain-containing protein, partial [Tannerella sp.]|nr:DNA translocase FtsK 4TM domain-containing protein [Tannerella sp.]